MNQTGAKILIIDDEPAIQKLLRLTLKAHGYQIIEASSGEKGMMNAGMNRLDLIILDLGLPDMSGLEVLKNLREWTQVPIIVLTVQEDERDKVTALDLGADDYMVKPFGMNELLARIRVALRHASQTVDEPVIELKGIRIDFVQRKVELHGKTIKLTPIEYDLLKILMQNAGKVVTHKQLLTQIWGNVDYNNSTHYLRVYIGHLRKKIETDSTQPLYIVTEPGIGYRFVAEQD
ncbi:response regulator [Alicyclobacillus tolerans]|uniref:Transcriptional regulatory protein KdpE n=1 Tax=Alicyclobacillus tolerans TaxID=90970 RepID=A0A1M6QMM0_9BACL|nr:response regulator [Alicyclobacillus montanus]SHK21502.1 two-component system, OmpR family, KDP operon response regulator KdpE [Alicyclobacillus montanus]